MHMHPPTHHTHTQIIIRHPIRTEYRVAFPFLYNSRPRSVHMAPYHHPMLYYIKARSDRH